MPCIMYTYVNINFCNYAFAVYVCEEVINTKEETRLVNAIHNRRGRELYTTVANKYITSVPA